MKKFIFPALFAFLFVFASCMNMSGSSCEGGSVRVVLPGSARYSFSQDKADKFVVTISLGSKLVDTKTGFSGGVIEFDELNPGDYTIEAKAFDSNEGDLVVGWGTSSATVNAGESTDCALALALTKCISTFDSVPSSSKYKYLAVASSADMVKLGEWVNSGSDLEGITITLADDVDLADCADWQPIGFVSESENKPFKGTFDGRGHSLSFDIGNIDSSNRFRKIGVFYKNDGVIENLVISQYLQDGKTLIVYGNSSQYAYSNAGGGICIENSGIVRNCINKSSIVASTYSDIGGICMSNAETGIIENCLFSGSITMNAKCSNGGDNQKSAGICPRNNGIIKNCVSNGSITTEAETDQNLPDSILNNISGAISVYTEGFIENCYWLKNNIKSGSSIKNRIAYTKSTYKKLTCIPDPSKITGCGYFDTNSPSASVTAGTTSECKSAQTLAYSGTLIQMLNAYVFASSDSGLKKWAAGADGSLALDF